MNVARWLPLVLAIGCAPTEPHPASLTSADARTARDLDGAQTALQRDDPTRAIAMADQALVVSPNDPWALYERGVALAKLGRTDEAVADLARAEVIYGDAHPHGKARAMYGRARALDAANRCVEARGVYDAYSAFVRPFAPSDADMAQRYAYACPGPVHKPATNVLSPRKKK